MWIISKSGFVSLVQHRDDPTKIRARARKRKHLVETFGSDITDTDIIDFGSDANDYRWHVDVPRAVVMKVLSLAVSAIDYESHAKEAMAGEDREFYRALLGCWRELYDLQV